MEYEVVRSFPYSLDGITSKIAEAGLPAPSSLSEADLRSLESEGYVARREIGAPTHPTQPDQKSDPKPDPEPDPDVAMTPPQEKSDIPPDWRKLSWPELRSLATSLSDTPVRDKNDAVKAIEKAEKKR